jgi:hypothetical protein
VASRDLLDVCVKSRHTHSPKLTCACLAVIGPQYDLAKELLLEEPQSDNEEEIEFQQQFHGVGLDDVEFNLDEFDYDIGPGGPEDEDDFL